MKNNKINIVEEEKGKVEALPLPSPSRHDSFMEEINVIRVEGRYFCFDGREASKRERGTYSYENSDGKKITIETGSFGYPSILAYRILQAIFRQITLEGKPYPNRIVFTKREIARLVGRDIYGGKDGQEIYKALRQLQDTFVTVSGSLNTKFEFEDRFNILGRLTLIRDKAEHNVRRHGMIEALAVEMNSAIMDSIRKGHIAIFNWGILESLEPLQAAMYKRLYLHLSNLFEMQGHKKEQLVFEKDYEAICAEWLGGLNPQKFKSLIGQQLRPHLEALIKTGLIRSFGVEERVKGTGFKLVFRPGKGFFQDYELFFRTKNVRQLQFKKTSDEADYLEPIDIVSAFFQKAKGLARSEDSMDKGDIEYARELVKKYGRIETLAFIQFACAEAPKTKFDMQTFRALKTFVGAWDANKEARDRHKVTQTAKDSETRSLMHRAEYDTLSKQHISRYLLGLPEEERSQLEAKAEENTIARFGRGAGHKVLVIGQLHSLVLTLSPIPPFEDWLKSLD